MHASFVVSPKHDHHGHRNHSVPCSLPWSSMLLGVILPLRSTQVEERMVMNGAEPVKFMAVNFNVVLQSKCLANMKASTMTFH